MTCCLLLSVGLFSNTFARAQDDENGTPPPTNDEGGSYSVQDSPPADTNTEDSASQDGKLAAYTSDNTGDSSNYAVQEGAANSAAPTSATANNANDGPVRLARFTYVSGNVTWRADDNSDWSTATVNLPIRQGAQLWVTGGGRAEIQFDDGSLLRLGTDALVTLQTLYSDADGEFTEIKLNAGLISLRLRHEHSIYQVDAPFISAKSVGPASLRMGAGIGADSAVEVAVKEGQVTIEGSQGKTTLHAPSYLRLRDADAPYLPGLLPARDTWERWNDDRDRWLNRAADRPSRHYVPENVGIVCDNLDDYGDWHNDDRYGHVWCPRVTGADWRPYYYGNWTWVSPFGWTWVSSEPWGWAPYHYGTWINRPYGWAWVPGPVNQYWCPAVVNFCEYNGSVGWCPLAPFEVSYPSFLNIGFRSRHWSAFFSIGSAAVYYPTGGGVCVPRPWNTTYVNRVTNITNITNVYNSPTTVINTHTTNTYLTHPFIPYNARTAGGVSVATISAFGGRGRYEPVPRGTTDIFTHGRPIGAPRVGHGPIAGPIAVRPTTLATTPSRTFEHNVQPPQTVSSRPVFRMPLQPNIARVSGPLARPHFPNGTTNALGANGGVRTAPVNSLPGNTLPGRSGRPIGNPAVNPDTGHRPAPVGLPGRHTGPNSEPNVASQIPDLPTRQPSVPVGTRPNRVNGPDTIGSGTRRPVTRPATPDNATGITSPAVDAARHAREGLGMPAGIERPNSDVTRPQTNVPQANPYEAPNRGSGNPVTVLPSRIPQLPQGTSRTGASGIPDTVRRARQDPTLDLPPTRPIDPTRGTNRVPNQSGQPSWQRPSAPVQVPATQPRTYQPYQTPTQRDTSRDVPAAGGSRQPYGQPYGYGRDTTPAQSRWMPAPQRAPEVYRVPDVTRSQAPVFRQESPISRPTYSAPPVVRSAPAPAPAPANTTRSSTQSNDNSRDNGNGRHR
ncbi:MAG: FecR domain-containing protein [Abitibacteriaceae bacterium]|nr:FecR domain-containing protein [Abditibacteriaceae bacterium]